MSGVPQIVALGEVLALFCVDSVGRLTSGAQAQLSFGGAEANLLVAAARLGVPGAWVGCAGDDALGDMIVRSLASEGIDVSAVARHPEAPTAAMVKWRRAGGMSNVDYVRRGSAGSALSSEHIPEGLIADAAVFHTTGITAGLSEMTQEAVMRAIDVAHNRGTLVSFDINHRRKVWGSRDARPVLRALVQSADVVFASVDEAALVVPEAVTEPMRLASSLHALGPSVVVIKEGHLGATMLRDGDIVHARARPIQVLDPVGAGDALAAGVLVGLLNGSSSTAVLRLGVDLGTYACTVPGDCEGLPDWRELDAFRMRQGTDVNR